MIPKIERRHRLRWHAGCCALALNAAALPAQAGESAGRAPIGLFTTMPIYWGESESLGELLRPEASSHWVRRSLERDHDLLPLDVLDGDGEDLPRLRYLLMAQPRALGAAENVALDDWVRGGGRLLLFADPWLDGESRFALGDPRRAHGTALVSPILARWGLRLEFDSDQAEGVRWAEVAGSSAPVDMAGRLAVIPTDADVRADCVIEAGGLLADCRIGDGRSVIFADATLLLADVPASAGPPPLEALTQRAFGFGDFAGDSQRVAPLPGKSMPFTMETGGPLAGGP